MTREGAYRCEYRVRQHDGSYRWVAANGRTELDEEGLAILRRTHGHRVAPVCRDGAR
ncbi:PAS domain-containing protein [Pseudomonas wadenswilerensis]|uniref:PAS domain-containing protein n=1 Tax=Pseudomonas wadenswilerensis TaxID=1785161 RepID=UPI0030B897E7